MRAVRPVDSEQGARSATLGSAPAAANVSAWPESTDSPQAPPIKRQIKIKKIIQ